MFFIDTANLKIAVLDYENFKLHVERNGELQRKLGVTVTCEQLEDCFKEIMAGQLDIMKNDIGNQYFYTNWQIILKSENKVCGGICFKGPPDAAGKVEIGYGVENEFRNRGIVSEAIREAVKWAFSEKNINVISAETDFDNIASQRALEKNGFVKIKEYDNLFYYEICR